MRFVVGGALVALGGLVVYGAITGRLAAMLAAIAKPIDLTDSELAKLHREGGAVAGTGSTPDVPAPPMPANPKTLAMGPSTDPSVGRAPVVAPAPAGALLQ